MKNRILKLLRKTKKANQDPNAHWLLPYIVESLEVLLDGFSKDNLDPDYLVRQAGGFGRIVMDDFSFSESPLGGELLELINAICKKYDSS